MIVPRLRHLNKESSETTFLDKSYYFGIPLRNMPTQSDAAKYSCCRVSAASASGEQTKVLGK